MLRMFPDRDLYPCWRHNVDGTSIIVKTREIDDALSDEWADNPSAFDVIEPPILVEPKKNKGGRPRKVQE